MSPQARIKQSGVPVTSVGNGKGNSQSFAPRPERTVGDDLAAPAPEAEAAVTLVAAAGGINSVTYDEARWASNSAFKNLSAAQKRGVHRAMERLDEWTGETTVPAGRREYDVTQWPGKNTVVYGALRNATRREETETRVELDGAGNIVAQNVGYCDQYGTVWYDEIDLDDGVDDDEVDESARWTKAR